MRKTVSLVLAICGTLLLLLLFATGRIPTFTARTFPT